MHVFEFRWRRWGEQNATLVEYEQDGTRSEVTSSPAMLITVRLRDDGTYETFAFPGNRVTADLETREPPTDEQKQELWDLRLEAFGSLR